MKRWLILLLPASLFALEEEPWFGDFCQFHARPLYEYNIFDRVDHAEPQLKNAFQTHLVDLELDITLPETWNFGAEIEFADTSKTSGYRSFALQVRKLWLDDVCGDPVSLTTGFVYRDSSKKLRKALSTPYHAQANFELHTAIGKEWSCGCYWTFRTYGLVAIGQGSEGYPWARGDLSIWWNYYDRQQVRLFSESYWGFGNRNVVPVDDFQGWSKIGHQSVDLGLSFRQSIGCYGWLRLSYQFRVYAKSYPEYVHTGIFSIDFPFSFF